MAHDTNEFINESLIANKAALTEQVVSKNIVDEVVVDSTEDVKKETKKSKKTKVSKEAETVDNTAIIESFLNKTVAYAIKKDGKRIAVSRKPKMQIGDVVKL